MPAKIFFFEKLLVVVWHANDVEFAEPKSRMDSSWMHISMDRPLVMDVSKCLTQLAENTEHLISSEFLLAVRFPSCDVIRCLSVEK